MRTPAASASAKASADTESKSPTATVTSSPSASAYPRPRSAATTGAPIGTVSAARGSGGFPPDTTTTTVSDTPSSAGITQIRFRGSAALSSALSARLPRAPRYAPAILAPAAFVDELAAATIGRTLNQYANGARAPLLRERLVRYLDERADAPILLVGEAPGYRGARVSGIPFTSERQLTGVGPAEATATIVHRVLRELGLADDVLLWNVVPTHPGTESSNRRPTRAEVDAGSTFLHELAYGRRVIAVGRVAHAVLGGDFVRHPSHGGAEAFRRSLRPDAHALVARLRP